MSGNKIGGLKARETNISKYGKGFYRTIGSKGGQTATNKPKGFAANPALAGVCGARGGRMSHRTSESAKEKEFVWKGGPDAKLVFKEEE